MNGWLTGFFTDAIWSKEAYVTPMPFHSNSYSNERMYAWLDVMYYTLYLYSRRMPFGHRMGVVIHSCGPIFVLLRKKI